MTPKHSILLVDDDLDLLRLLTMRLSAAGYEVSTAESAEAALAQLAVSQPTLVISDVRLPGLDGLQLFAEIRGQHPALPVILLTAHGTIPDAVDATSRGAFAYLTKPFDSHELLDKVCQATSLSPGSTGDEAGDNSWREEIISRSQAMADVLAEARLVAATDASFHVGKMA